MQRIRFVLSGGGALTVNRQVSIDHLADCVYHYVRTRGYSGSNCEVVL